MKKVDYIIVGDGFAALFFAHQLIKNKCSFVMFSDQKVGASKISAGMVNPVVLKKFTTFDNALEQINVLEQIFKEMSAYLKRPVIVEEHVYRIFHDDKEKETWTKKCKEENLSAFLDPEFTEFKGIQNPSGCGRIKHSFRVNVPVFFEEMVQFLKETNSYVEEVFDHSLIQLEDNTYKEFEFSKIVFAEGIGVKENPFFNTIPIQVNKGHHLSVPIKDLSLQGIVKKKHFLFSLENDLFYYGGTYDRDNESLQVDERAADQLERGLREIIEQEHSIHEVRYAFRPTVSDRRPILGNHSVHSNFYVFNGLGTRGLLNGSFFAEHLFNYCHLEIPLPEEVSISRFN